MAPDSLKSDSMGLLLLLASTARLSCESAITGTFKSLANCTFLSTSKPSISKAKGVAYCQQLLAEFDNAAWLQKLAKELADK